MDIHADLVYSHTGYDLTVLLPVSIYQSSKKRPLMPPPTVLGRILVVRSFAWLSQLVGFLFTLTSRNRLLLPAGCLSNKVITTMVIRPLNTQQSVVLCRIDLTGRQFFDDKAHSVSSIVRFAESFVLRKNVSTHSLNRDG